MKELKRFQQHYDPYSPTNSNSSPEKEKEGALSDQELEILDQINKDVFRTRREHTEFF